MNFPRTYEEEFQRVIDQALKQMDEKDFKLLRRIKSGEITKFRPAMSYVKMAQLGVIITRLDNSVEISKIGKAVLKSGVQPGV